ncbi:MAG: LarC family nickel insertion protein [Gammaproteobacteria bacterium]|nr:LarC family nickel insertion protein [Gammaproteobacteria bacterium]
MHIHLDPVGGLAGDMFCAAILDAYPRLLEELLVAVRGLEPPEGIRVELDAAPGPLKGKRFSVSGSGTGGHGHRQYRDIVDLLGDSPLKEKVRVRAMDIFHHLAEAEGFVHGIEPEQVTFHEVGNWDSIVDIVGASFLLESVGVDSASTGPLPLGRGRVNTAHGALPIPAPATVRLLEGFEILDDGIPGERVTPTGAAILKSLQPWSRVPTAENRLQTAGTGFGTCKLEGIPNCLRVLFFARDESRTGSERVGVIEFEVDDQTPEDLGIALERLRRLEGVLSVNTIPRIGKRGRMTMGVEILTRTGYVDTVGEQCFRETTTIGLRWHEVRRLVLERRAVSVSEGGVPLEVKIVERGETTTAKVESRGLVGIPCAGERDRLRQRGVERALPPKKEV